MRLVRLCSDTLSDHFTGEGSATLSQVKTATKQSKKSAVNRRARQDKTPKPNNQESVVLRCPIYKPVYKFNRVIESSDYNISCDGINSSLGAIIFSLDALPSYTDFTNLFDMYRIGRISIQYNPEYTELTDAALVSNAVNVFFNSVIDLNDPSTPTTVDEILQYQQLSSTRITKQHKRSWCPTILMGGLTPCSCFLPTVNPSEQHLCFKYAIPPTGVAMVFRARIKYELEFANVH